MTRRERIHADIPRGRCFRCNATVFDKTVVFFGPGEFMKCGGCGSWSPEEMKAAEERIGSCVPGGGTPTMGA